MATEQIGAGSPRARYLDLVRVLAIGAVVVGHWLAVDISYAGGQLVGRDALAYVGWGGRLTLVFQVMPVFFVVGGYVNATSWTAHRARGVRWAEWVQGRAERLLWPTTAYLVFVAAAMITLAGTGLDAGELAQAGRLLTLHLWFLPVYLMLIAATPLLLAAHRRWGLRAAAVMAVGAAGVDVAVSRLGSFPVGYANYLLVWGSMHQWGFAWRDARLTRPRRPLVLATVGAVGFAVLVTLGPYPADLIGAGGQAGNTSPPTLALLAFAAAQTGLLVALAPAGARLLEHPGRWRLVQRLNSAVIVVYLWHTVPVLALALTGYRTGALPQPRIDSWQWWLLRPVWIAALTVVLVPLVLAVTRALGPLRRIPPPAGPVDTAGATLLVVGLAAACLGLVRLAVGGAAPGGGPATAWLLAYGFGAALTLATGHASRAHSGRRDVTPH